LRVGVSIEKATSFRGGVQPFSNVYYYDAPIPETDTALWTELVDQLVTKEKALHATTITFVRGRLWRADGTEAENVMIVDKSLSGTGALSASTAMDKERAFLVQISAGFDSKGRPVKLRKWLHCNAGVMGGSAVTNGQLVQTESLVTAQRDAIKAFGDDIISIGVGAGGSTECLLTAKSGRDPTGAASAHPYLEHHQLGDQWRNV
jgi:hypothetical protein